MTAHTPPVPLDQQAKHGPDREKASPAPTHDARPGNTAEQGRTGNIHQNTTNNGFQQDR